MSDTAKNPQNMSELLVSTKFTLKALRPGDTIEGTVATVGRSEVFVDIGAKSEGVISGRYGDEEMALSKGLKEGDKVFATVVQREDDQGYIVLSLRKAAGEKSWRDAERVLAESETVEVKVTDYNKGGLVADWEAVPGSALKGFIPFSHLSASFAPSPLGDEAASSLVGKNLSVRIIELDREGGRIVFSQRRADQNEAKVRDFVTRTQGQSAVEGEVTGVFPYGVTVALAEGVEGLLRVSEMDWVRLSDLDSLFKAGDRLEVQILGFDAEQGKLLLTRKPLRQNPWESISENYKVGDRIKGVVTKIVQFGAFVRLPEGIEGLIHVSETTGPLKVGEETEAVIINLEPARQKLGLSIKKL